MASIETVVSICNKALIKIDAPTISAIDENSKSAIKCNEFYAYCRDKLLQDHPWNFAKERAELSLDGDTPLYEFSYQYVIPEDCLRVLTCTDSDGNSLTYEVEGNLLLANENTVYIKYIKRVTNTALFSQGFIDCLILSLAKELAYSIAGSDSKVDRLTLEYDRELSKARKKNGQEQSVKIIKQNTWTNSRLI